MGTHRPPPAFWWPAQQAWAANADARSLVRATGMPKYDTQK